MVCSIAVIFGGCAKKQTGPQIVYVPAPPPAAAPSQSGGSMVVRAPAPAVPREVPPEPVLIQPREPAPEHHSHHRRPESKAPAQKPAAVVPALKSGISSGQATKLESRVVKLQQDIEKRIDTLSREWLSPAQRGTLEGARGFLQSSQRAVKASDFQRAYNLAHKADLLVVSLEQSQ